VLSKDYRRTQHLIDFSLLHRHMAAHRGA